MKNEGYTFIEVIIAISILSILLWTIIPQFRRLEGFGDNILISTKDNTTMTHLVKALTSDISGIHWSYWQPSPQLEITDHEIRIKGKTEIADRQYTIRREGNSIILDSSGIIRKYSFSSLNDFNIVTDDSPFTDFTLIIGTPKQSLKIPLYFGSKTVSIHEEI